ncbi:hypothetical protein SteCoe_22842 [Stentor coeruleus]|uniref:FYVE-type domain-containing protein n=1 Tax=Stentor coeruleus TaxID=5963 RepID=A0A1R2BL55_9CILI|nr:hypothetical protein SteCoe_22842 [Stentor coeruleus]
MSNQPDITLQQCEPSPTNADSKKDRKCFVCNKKFGLGKKYQCFMCQNYVCIRHSMKRRNEEKNSKSYICDVCDIEQMREEIKAEILQELNKLNENIKLAKDSYEKTEASRVKEATKVSKLEEEVLAIEKKQKAKEEEILLQLNEELNKGEKARESVDAIKKELEELYMSEQKINEKCSINEVKNEETKSDILKIKEKKNELLAQVEHLSGNLKGSLPLDQVLPHLCESCKKRVSVDGKSLTKDSEKKHDDSSLLSND